jgi:hypothetical protein
MNEEHLEAIGQMLIDFKNEHKMGNQINISGYVKDNHYKSLSISSDSVAFDNKTIKEVKDLGYSLNEKIRKYLEDNKIKEFVKISTRKDLEFGTFFNGFVVSYEVTHTTKG